jgi:hypothetical protein
MADDFRCPGQGRQADLGAGGGAGKLARDTIMEVIRKRSTLSVAPLPRA